MSSWTADISIASRLATSSRLRGQREELEAYGALVAATGEHFALDLIRSLKDDIKRVQRRSRPWWRRWLW